MSQDEFTKLFTYMSGRFDTVDKTLEQKADKEDVSRILCALDTLAKRQEISDDERIVMGHQIERPDK